MFDLVIVSAFFNENKNLLKFIKEWLYETNKLNLSTFFLFINDGSTDESSSMLKNYIAKNSIKNITIFDIDNIGAGRATIYGLSESLKIDAGAVLQIDSDGQCSPKYLVNFMNRKYKEKINIFGYRKKRNDGFLRLVFSKLFSLIFFLKSGLYIKDLNTPYRLYQKIDLARALEKIKLSKDIYLRNAQLNYQFHLMNLPIEWENITFMKRHGGQSKLNKYNMLKQLIEFLTSF